MIRKEKEKKKERADQKKLKREKEKKRTYIFKAISRFDYTSKNRYVKDYFIFWNMFKARFKSCTRYAKLTTQ